MNWKLVVEDISTLVGFILISPFLILKVVLPSIPFLGFIYYYWQTNNLTFQTLINSFMFGLLISAIIIWLAERYLDFNREWFIGLEPIRRRK